LAPRLGISDVIDSVIAGFAANNDVPMANMTSHIPSYLYADNFDLFQRRVITAEDFQQRIHNAATLWLIE